MSSRMFLSLLFLLHIGCDRARAGNVRASERADDKGSVAAANNHEIPFELYHGFLIVVRGRLGSLDSLKFILDTGTSRSVVDRKTAEKLELQRHPAYIGHFAQEVSVEGATFPEVQFGPIQAAGVPMLIADLRRFSEFASGADAIIGMDLLRSASFLVDYETQKIQFRNVTPNALDRLGKGPLGLFVNLEIQGHPVRLMVSTGVEGILLYEERLRRRKPRLKTVGKTEAGATMGWQLRGWLATVRGIHLGNGDTERSVFFAEDDPTEVPDDIVGLLGIAALKARRVEFDFSTNRLRWQ